MFEKNDKQLLTIRTVIDVITILFFCDRHYMRDHIIGKQRDISRCFLAGIRSPLLLVNVARLAADDDFFV